MTFGFITQLFVQDKDFYNLIYTTLHIRPNKLTLYKLALRHKSAASEIKQGVKNSNERLEFLGDAVLGLVIGKMLFKKFQVGIYLVLFGEVINNKSNRL